MDYVFFIHFIVNNIIDNIFWTKGEKLIKIYIYTI